MHNMCNLVNYCVPLTGGSISGPFHDIESPNLVGTYYNEPKSKFYYWLLWKLL